MSSAKVGGTDSLTGALNYQTFLEEFDKRMVESDKTERPLSLALVDIDFFERMNDEHGREGGDEVLKAVTAHLEESAPEGSEVFRYAKDEFIVLMPGVEKERAFLSLEQMRTAFDGEHDPAVSKEKGKVRLSLSVGIATYPDDGSKPQELIRKATDALYRAKMLGRNRVCLAREEKMVTKTSHYTQGQLERLAHLAKREGVGEAILLREGLDDLLRKYSL